jgi:hypothetical protein
LKSLNYYGLGYNRNPDKPKTMPLPTLPALSRFRLQIFDLVQSQSGSLGDHFVVKLYTLQEYVAWTALMNKKIP